MTKKFYGVIGYANRVEKAPGVWDNEIVERKYYGDVIKNSRRLDSGDQVNEDFKIGNSFSIVADPYAYEHFFDIEYIAWMGTLWVVTEVTVERPRLLIRVGGVYNGPTAPPVTDNP